MLSKVLKLIFFSGIFFVPSLGKVIFCGKNSTETMFENFIKTFSKQYANDDEKKNRFEIFTNNLKEIELLNHVDTATYAVNQFADLSNEEFIRKHTGHCMKPFGQGCKVIYDEDIHTHDAPDELNWKHSGMVTQVKNQNDCSSGWAFATVGNIEGQYVKKHGSSLDFSPQELIDCCDDCDGCNGGYPTDAMSALMYVGGLEKESSYPYVARQHKKCNYKPENSIVKVVGCTTYDLHDEDNLKEVLAKTGPLYIAVAGDQMRQFSSGIQECKKSGDVNHAVLLIGYGTQNGSDYWLIKNSWGTSWGDKGYAKLRRGVNACGLMNPAIASATIN